MTLVAFLVLPLNGLSGHPLKMSVANLSYDAEKAQYVLDLRVFVDDYLVVMGVIESEYNYDESIAFLPRKSDVRKYLAKHFQLFFNGENVSVQVDKVRTEEMTVYISLKVAETYQPDLVSRVEVHNTVFVEEFSNQRNVLHVDFPGQRRKTILCNKYYPKGEVQFDQE